jgi:AcrR family transcriptional regulator
MDGDPLQPPVAYYPDMATQAARSEATRGALVLAGRRLFGERGFAGAPLDEVVRDAGVTKGALYHHFPSKEALFLAVFEDVEQDLVERVVAEAKGGVDGPAKVRMGVRAFVIACQDPVVQRIVLQDAPAVLGWEVWRAVDSCHFSALLQDALTRAMTDEQRRRRPVELLTQVLRGALTEAAQLAGRSSDPETLATVLEVIDDVLDGLVPARVRISASC